MSNDRTNTGSDTAPRAGRDTRYVPLEVQDGGTLIYDRENPRAWIRSTEAIALDEGQ